MEKTKAGIGISAINTNVLNMSSPLMRENRHSEVTEGSRNYKWDKLRWRTIRQRHNTGGRTYRHALKRIH